MIHPSFFSLSKLKSSFHKNTIDKELSVYVLEKNYRNSKQVIEIANRILHLKNYCFASEDKMTKGEEKAFFMNSDTKNIGNASVISDNEKEKITGKVSDSTNWAVLVLDDESKENARKSFNTPLVFNIHEVKGLEYKNVVLYEFMSNKAYNGIWNIIKGKKKVEDAISEVDTSRNKNKEDKSFEQFKFYINALYVAITRAIDGVYIIGNEKKCNLLKAIKPEVKKPINVDIKKEESTPEEWKKMALELIDKRKIEQARDIAETKLINTKYAEEIMKELEIMGYRKKQAISELKTEPQGSSTVVPNEKRKQHPHKKLTKRRLEENTNKLFLALENRNLLLAEQLIGEGINVNAKDQENGDTPLHIAAYNGHERVVALLLERGVNVDATSKEGDTPLHLAADKGYESVIQALLDHGAKKVNATDQDGSTPLFIAAGKNYKRIAQLLLEHGVNVDDSNKNGYTPLHVAAQDGYENVAQLLLRRGASLSATTNKKGYTPLHVAAQKGHERVVAFLLQNKADVNAKDNKNYTPLHDAAQNGSESVVQLLLDHGADINALTKGYVTPLLLALQHFKSKVLDLLLADPNINMGHVSYIPASAKNKIDYHKYDVKHEQDANLFKKVKEVANERDVSMLDMLLIEVEKLLARK